MRALPPSDKTPAPPPAWNRPLPHKARTRHETPHPSLRWNDEPELSLHSRLPFLPFPFCWVTLPSLRCRTRLRGLPLHLGNIDAFFGHFVQGRKLSQFTDHLNHLIDDVVYFFLRIKAP